jgi:hypothetical protein
MSPPALRESPTRNNAPTVTAGVRARGFSDQEIAALFRVAGRLPQRLRAVFIEAVASDASESASCRGIQRDLIARSSKRAGCCKLLPGSSTLDVCPALARPTLNLRFS